MQNTVPVVPLTVGDVWARVRRRPVMVAVPLALGLAAGVGYAVLAPPTYNSTASVVVQPLISDQFGGVNIANVINMATEAQVAQSSQVAGLAAKRLKVPAAQVRDGLSVAAPQGTQVIELHYSADNQQAASDGAQVVAESYLAYREGAAGADADRRLAAIQKQIDDANLKLSLKNSSQAAYQDSLRALLADQRTLTAVKATAGGRIISAASWPGTPSAPKASVDVAVGLLAGALAGLALTVLWPGGARLRTGGPSADAARRAGSRPSSRLDDLFAGSDGDADSGGAGSDDGSDDSEVGLATAADDRGEVSPSGPGEGTRRLPGGAFSDRPDGGRTPSGRSGRSRFDKGRPGSGRPGGGPGGSGSGTGTGTGAGGQGAGGYLVGGAVPVSGGSSNGGSSSGASNNGGSSSGGSGSGASGGSAPSATLGEGGPRAVRTTAQATGRPAQPVAPAAAPQARPAPGPVGPASAAVAPPSPAQATRASVWQSPSTAVPADSRRPDVPELDRLVRPTGGAVTATLSSSQLVPPQAAPSEPLSLDVAASAPRATDRPPAPRAASEARTEGAPKESAPKDAGAKDAGAKDAGAKDAGAKDAKDDPEPPAPESLPWFRR